MSYTLYVRRYAPFARFGGAFHGDKRSGPSVSLKDTARTIGVLGFNRTGITSTSGSSSGTSMVGPLAKLGTHYGSVSMTVLSLTPTASGFKVSLQTAGANPMVPGAPDIDTFVDVSFGWGIGTLTAGGHVWHASFAAGASIMTLTVHGEVRGDNFPNAEVFLMDMHGRGVLLFDYRTGGGPDTGPFTRLSGAHAGLVLGSFSTSIMIDAHENFLGSTPSAPTPIHGP